MSSRAFIIGSFVVLTILLRSPLAAQQATFQGLGDLDGGRFHSIATGVSSDGIYVCGVSLVDGDVALSYRWDETSGMVPLLDGHATDVSSNRTMVGTTGIHGSREAARWVDTAVEGLGWIGNQKGGGGLDSIAWAVSANGVIIGESTSPRGAFEAFRWENGTMQPLGDLPGSIFDSRAYGVSDNGEYVVGEGSTDQGFGEGEVYFRRAFLWHEGQMIDLGAPPGHEHSNANDVSADGSVVVGSALSETDSIWKPARWSNGSAMLIPLPQGASGGDAIAVSGDGRVVIGNTDLHHPFLWNPYDGTRELRVILEQDYGVDLTGWWLFNVTDISADGRRIVGTGFNPQGNVEGWVVTFPQPDTDGDGLLDSWETDGIDINGDGTIDLDLPAMGADPMHKDLFVEIDIMSGAPFSDSGIQAVEFAFANAPVENPDGRNGIDLHADYGSADSIPFAEMWNIDWSDFDTAKTSYFGTADERDDPNWEHIEAAKKRAFRYCIFANRLSSDDGSHPVGRGELPGNDFVVTLGGMSEWGSRAVASTFMHELGHNLGLGHGGKHADGRPDHTNYKPNYISVMNYGFDDFRDIDDRPLLPDFSVEAGPALDESSINENMPYYWSGTQHEGVMVIHGYRAPGAQPQVGHVSIINFILPDWNHDGENEDSIAIDLNWLGPGYPGDAAVPSPGEPLTAFNDWVALELPIGADGDFADGVHETTDYPELSEEVIIWHRENVPPAPINTAVLTDAQITTGTILDGDVSALEAADQTHLHTRSGYGGTLIDLHHMELIVQATTDVVDPVSMDVMVRSQLSDAGGTAYLRLRNWNTGALDLIGTYGTSTTQTANFFTDIDASEYVGVNGEIELSIKHIIHVPFLAYTFESFIDQVQVTVE